MMQRQILRRAAVFHAIASTGSIAGAAIRVGKSAPAIHHDLKCLEAELGRPLFDRVGRKLRLTPAARHLHEGLSRNLDEIERALTLFADSPEPGQTLRIAAVSGFARYRLAPRLFAKAGARRVELIVGSHEEVIAALLAGRADAAITYKPVVAVPLSATPLAQEDYVLIGSAGAPAVRSLEAIEGLGFVTYDEYEYVFASWFESMFGRQPRRLGRSDHVMELEEALESVASSRGVTITPADAWLAGPWRRRCRNLFPGRRRATNALYLLTLAGAAWPAASWLIDLLGDGRPEARSD